MTTVSYRWYIVIFLAENTKVGQIAVAKLLLQNNPRIQISKLGKCLKRATICYVCVLKVGKSYLPYLLISDYLHVDVVPDLHMNKMSVEHVP